MKTNNIPQNIKNPCPFCLSENHIPIYVKNYKRCIDSVFLEQFVSTTQPGVDKLNTEIDLKNTPHFFQCETCEAIFRNPLFILKSEEEHLRYQNHNNHIEDVNYIHYLSHSLSPFLNFISSQEKGLDFGCGPSKGIEALLKPQNYQIESYDKYFFPHTFSSDARPKYDYIFCHEVIEHFVDFKKEFTELVSLLKPQGQLLIRTELHKNDLNHFEDWYYKNDSTHVFFLSLNTFNYLSEKLNFDFKHIDSNKFILSKFEN